MSMVHNVSIVVPAEPIMELLACCVKNCFLQERYSFFIQEDHLPMGSPLSPFIYKWNGLKKMTLSSSGNMANTHSDNSKIEENGTIQFLDVQVEKTSNG